MQWIPLNDLQQLEEIKVQSSDKPVLIFKHSTRCSISRASLDRLERNWRHDEMNNVAPYFLDLLSYRAISNQIETQFNVEHQSPQVLIIRDGKAVHDASHFEIDYQQILKTIKS